MIGVGSLLVLSGLSPYLNRSSGTFCTFNAIYFFDIFV